MERSFSSLTHLLKRNTPPPGKCRKPGSEWLGLLGVQMVAEELVNYVSSAPQGVEFQPIHENVSYRVAEVFIPSPKSGKIPAYFVEPIGTGKYPAVLFLHPAVRNKDHFLEDARKLARMGIASLLVDAPMARPDPWKQVGSLAEPELERELYIQTLLDLRRSIDFLEAQKNIDPTRISFVGQNYGASLGALLAGHDKRIMSYVLIGGIPNLSQFWEKSSRQIAVKARETMTPEQIQKYVDSTREFAAVHFIKHAAPASVFFQFAKWDNWITKAMALQFYDASSSPKRIRFYDVDHNFNSPEAKAEYMNWLKLKFSPPTPPVAN